MVKWEEIVLRGAALERLAGEHWKMAVYTRPFGRDLICEAADVEFAQDAQIPYHPGSMDMRQYFCSLGALR